MSAQGRSGCGSILGRTQPLDLGLKVAFTASMSPSLPQRRQRTSTFPAGGPEEAASVSPLSLAAPTVAGKPPSATWPGMFRAALSSRSGRACGTSVMHTRTRCPARARARSRQRHTLHRAPTHAAERPQPQLFQQLQVHSARRLPPSRPRMPQGPTTMARALCVPLCPNWLRAGSVTADAETANAQVTGLELLSRHCLGFRCTRCPHCRLSAAVPPGAACFLAHPPALLLFF